MGLALTPFAPSLAALFALSTVYAAGAGLATPTLNSLCSQATPEPRQGEMFGLLQAARSLGFLLGPILGSVLFDGRVQAPYLLAAVTFPAFGGHLVKQNLSAKHEVSQWQKTKRDRNRNPVVPSLRSSSATPCA